MPNITEKKNSHLFLRFLEMERYIRIEYVIESRITTSCVNKLRKIVVRVLKLKRRRKKTECFLKFVNRPHSLASL